NSRFDRRLYLLFTIGDLLLFYSFQKRIDALGFLFNGVPYEVKRGSMPQIQRKAKLLSHIWCSMVKRLQRFVVFRFIAGNGDVNAGVAQVVCNANFRDGHGSQSRIFKFVPDNLSDLFKQRFSDAFWPVHCFNSFGSRVSSSECALTRNLKLETRNFLRVPWLRSSRSHTLQFDRRV